MIKPVGLYQRKNYRLSDAAPTSRIGFLIVKSLILFSKTHQEP